MTEDFDTPTELESDDPPKDGTWVETCDVLPEPTADELALGEAEGMYVNHEGNDDEPEMGQ